MDLWSSAVLEVATWSAVKQVTDTLIWRLIVVEHSYEGQGAARRSHHIGVKMLWMVGYT